MFKNRIHTMLMNADPGGGGGNPPADPPKNDPPAGDPPAGDPPKDEPKFTQADLDRIVKERLARAQKKAEEDAEKKRLEEEGKIKELYDKTKQELEDLQKQLRDKEVDELKAKAITAAGYTAEQIEFIKGKIAGETEEELTAAVAEFAKFMPPTSKPQGGDPNPGNGRRQDPEPKSDEELGRSLYQRLRGKKK